MRPELFTIPFVNLSIKSYGTMMVLGFLAALFLAHRLSRRLGEESLHISDFGIYALLAGVIGARLFHVIHYWPHYRDNLPEIVAIWSGGLEFLGGFIGALAVMIPYFHKKKLSILKFLDILAPALMLGLAFGRIGCFMNGCCFGAPSNLPWAIRFPPLHMRTSHQFGCHSPRVPQYGISYDYQLIPDRQRRDKPLLKLPDDYYEGYLNTQGDFIYSLQTIPPEQKKDYYPAPKPPAGLSESQRQRLENGEFPMVPIHPAQIYSSLTALALCLILTLVITRYYRFRGQVFFLMLVLYGVARFFLEAIRNSSPLEFNGLTISQNLSILSILGGLLLLAILRKKNRIPPASPSPRENAKS